jgi:hypothetical protein
MTESMQTNSYMNGKGKLWFWAIPALFLFSIVTQYLLVSVFRPSLCWVSVGAFIAIDIAFWVIFGCGMAIALTKLAMACTVKTYRILFQLLACMQVPIVISGVLYNWETLYGFPFIDIISDATWNMLSVCRFVISLLNIITISSWGVCLFIIGCGKPANIIIRVSSMLFALFCIFVTVLCDPQYYIYEAGILYAVLATFYFSTFAFTKPRR